MSHYQQTNKQQCVEILHRQEKFLFACNALQTSGWEKKRNALCEHKRVRKTSHTSNTRCNKKKCSRKKTTNNTETSGRSSRQHTNLQFALFCFDRPRKWDFSASRACMHCVHPLFMRHLGTVQTCFLSFFRQRVERKIERLQLPCTRIFDIPYFFAKAAIGKPNEQNLLARSLL